MINTSYKFISLAVTLLVVHVKLPAQGNSSGTKSKAEEIPEVQWSSLIAASKPSPGNSPQVPKGSPADAALIAAQAGKSRAMTASAKEPYTKKSNHTDNLRIAA